jgi:hypothetical protein
MLKELARARFPEDREGADAMRRAEELAGQQPDDTAAFVVVTEEATQGEEEKWLGDARQVINSRPRTMVGSRKAEEEAWALAAAIAAQQERGCWRWRRMLRARPTPCCRHNPRHRHGRINCRALPRAVTRHRRPRRLS